MLSFIFFWIRMSLKEAESEELVKTVVTCDKNESKEILKYTVNAFKKQNVPESEQFIILL